MFLGTFREKKATKLTKRLTNSSERPNLVLHACEKLLYFHVNYFVT